MRDLMHQDIVAGGKAPALYLQHASYPPRELDGHGQFRLALSSTHADVFYSCDAILGHRAYGPLAEGQVVAHRHPSRVRQQLHALLSDQVDSDRLIPPVLSK